MGYLKDCCEERTRSYVLLKMDGDRGHFYCRSGEGGVNGFLLAEVWLFLLLFYSAREYVFVVYIAWSSLSASSKLELLKSSRGRYKQDLILS